MEGAAVPHDVLRMCSTLIGVLSYTYITMLLNFVQLFTRNGIPLTSCLYIH